jgi:hypothetical protein
MFSQNSEKLIFKWKWYTKRSETKWKEAKKRKKAKSSEKERTFDWKTLFLLPLTSTESRVDTKFRDSKFRNKNYFPISRNYNIILPKFWKMTFAISVQICKKLRVHEKIGQLWELNPKITTNVIGHDKNRPPLEN